MGKTTGRWLSLAILTLGGLFCRPALAQAPTVPPSTAVETEAEKRERETRTACAEAICSTLYNHKPDAGQVSCAVTKTWRKEVVEKILSQAKLRWPWGYARCSTDLQLDRSMLVKAMLDAEVEVRLDSHDIKCELEGETEKYGVTLQISPKVTFKQGKAIKASLNWGKIVAPTLAKSALWSATAADNAFGILQSTLVEDVNRFIETRCMEVKEAWQGK
ncbi:MAG TPA: hypothetical protein VFR19_02460 [Hyphomicrobiaceae bacterium]|jgi:hypothetical protein|nr:hypothetical protein [Hyphomicrobiaceae bacterium]